MELNQPRLLQRAIRQNAFLRRGATRELLENTLSKFIPVSCPSFDLMVQSVRKLDGSSGIAEFDSNLEVSILPESVIPEVEVSVCLLLAVSQILFSGLHFHPHRHDNAKAEDFWRCCFVCSRSNRTNPNI